MDLEENKSELQKVIRQFKRSLIYVGIFSAFINLLGLTQILYMIQIFDRVLSSRSVETLIMLTLVITVLVITWGVLEYIRDQLLKRLANKLELALHERLFHAVFEYNFEQKGEVNAIALDDINTLRGFLTGPHLVAFFDAPWLIIYGAILYLFHPALAIYVIVVAAISLLLAYIQHINTKHLLVEAGIRKMDSKDFISTSLKNTEILSALGMKDRIQALWKEKQFAFLTSQSKSDDANTKLTNLSKSVKNYAGILVFGLAAYLAITGEITMGMIIGARILVGKAIAPIDILISGWTQVGVVRMSYNRLNKLLEVYKPVQKPMPLLAPSGNLIVDKVYYSPGEGIEPIIKDLSFLLFKGENLAVIGHSASGKSTLAKVLLGIWPATLGTVRLDGANIALWDRNHLGQYIGYLPQDIELFNCSVSDNICRFDHRDPEKIIEAAETAGVHHMILKLPNGYDTIIGTTKGAVPLSGGQKQRIGLARAIYNEPRFVILDEPNSNLDEQGDNALLECLAKLKENGTTVIIITHRPNILMAADKILVLSDGMLQMFGPRDKVLEAINHPASLEKHTEQNNNKEADNSIVIEEENKNNDKK